MQAHVNLEASFRGEQATTDMAGKKLLATMCFKVTIQRWLDSEALITACTLVWSLSCVDSNVTH